LAEVGERYKSCDISCDILHRLCVECEVERLNAKVAKDGVVIVISIVIL
jgi:hypothetical protein